MELINNAAFMALVGVFGSQIITYILQKNENKRREIRDDEIYKRGKDDENLEYKRKLLRERCMSVEKFVEQSIDDRHILLENTYEVLFNLETDKGKKFLRKGREEKLDRYKEGYMSYSGRAIADSLDDKVLTKSIKEMVDAGGEIVVISNQVAELVANAPEVRNQGFKEEPRQNIYENMQELEKKFMMACKEVYNELIIIQTRRRYE